MRINSLHIQNFRAIKNLKLEDLNDTVVIAGSNGCGKTQIFNAIRLLKSAYGGYQPNEYQQWFGEFQIDLNKHGESSYRMFRDRNKPIFIKAEFDLKSDELLYLRETAEIQTKTRVWQEIAPELQYTGLVGGIAYAKAQRVYGAEVKERVEKELEELDVLLKRTVFQGELIIEPELNFNTTNNVALELLFSIYEPKRLGVLDYHGAHRTYNREQIGGISLNINQSEQIGRHHSLYNWANKYSNIKSELASGYIRDLIAKEAKGDSAKTSTLISSLQELFAKFFPGKIFKGPTPGPDGTLDFPVEVTGEAVHDIDDLSSGEKEVLFGYLRLRNNSPRNSIILIDEPELHLNPALLNGLPQFYHKYIGKDLGNQLWLVTHSDTLLRESVGQPGFSVYHMRQAQVTTLEENQLISLDTSEPLNKAIIDLIGDLASYQPGEKVVIFEGGGDVDFDVRMTTTLFPKLRNEANPISVGDKNKVRNLHHLLKTASEKGKLPFQFFSIVDRDSDTIVSDDNSFSWDRYHIENYLLEPKYIVQVLQDLNIKESNIKTEKEVLAKLKSCAEKTFDELVRRELEQMANSTIISTVKTATRRDGEQIAPGLYSVIASSQVNMKAVISEKLNLKSLEKQEKILRNKYTQYLKKETWVEEFRGRDILKRFVDEFVRRVNYDVFRDMILAKMLADNYKPSGMAHIIETIFKSNDIKPSVKPRQRLHKPYK